MSAHPFSQLIYYYQDYATPSPGISAPFPLPGMASSYEKRSKLLHRRDEGEVSYWTHNPRENADIPAL